MSSVKCSKFLEITLVISLVISLFVSERIIASELSAKTEDNSASAVQLFQYSETAASLGFELEGMTHEEVLIDDQSFDRFRIDGETAVGKEGYPELPTVVRFMLIPPQSGVELRIDNLVSRNVANGNPFPIQPLDDDEDSDARYSNINNFDNDSFTELKSNLDHESGADGFYPTTVARVGTPVIMRGYRIAPVFINPLRYNPETHEIQIIESMDLELDFNSDENAVNFVENPDRPRPSRYVDKIIRDLVLNPPPERDVPPVGGSIMYVIGNWDDIEEEIDPLVEWRRRMGWTVEVVRVAQNSTNAIKTAIIEAYEEWDTPPEHVVICGDTDGQYPRAYWDMRRGADWPYETDHQYVEIEGNDVLPDATVGRLIFNSRNMCRGLVEKTVEYESNPYIGEGEERGWQKRAVLVAADNRSGTSSIDLCRWSKDMFQKHGFNGFEELYWTPQTPQPNARQFIINNINNGASVFLYRGWTYMSWFEFEDVNSLRNGSMLPFVMLATCNTGDYGEHTSSEFYYSERFSYHPNGGAIGAVGSAGATHTAYNNLISASTFKAFMADGIYSQGWALMKSKVDLFRHYFDRGDINHHENPGLEGWLCELYIFNLMGDPAVDLYTDVPRDLVVDRPEVIRPGENHFEITVEFDEDTPAEDVLVCLYKPGDFQLVARSDENGFAEFDVDPEWTQDGTIQLTLTGHNLMPVLVDYEIGETQYFVGNSGVAIDDDNQGASLGNDDGIANPLERLEIAVDIMNFGTETPEGEVSLVLTPGAPHLEVLEGEAALDAVPDPGASTTVNFVVEIGGGYSDSQTAFFDLEITARESSWNTVVVIPVESADLQFESMEWVENPLLPGQNADVRILLRNKGSRPSPDLQATLISKTRTVGAVNPNAEYDAIEIDEDGMAVFTLSAHPLHLGGVPAEFDIALESNDGFQDTTSFTFWVDQGGEGEPFGPDSYGYVCFDNTDENWFISPVFEWIEIDPNNGGSGTDTELQDTAEERDASVLVQIPFTFTYYGEDFDELTVCTNGWLAMGDHAEIITARNRRIPSGMVGSSMICPFWDDLLTTDEGGIYTWHDEDNHLFVVEWVEMRKLGPQGRNEPLETFQVILYDPEFHPSFTGDGDVKFQYLEVTDDRSCYQEWDTPFATVGLGDPEQVTGLEYTYWGELNRSAAPLDSGLAILFTTLLDFQTGVIMGHVVDAISDEPLQDVLITTTYGFSGITDSTGFFLIPDVLIDTAITYQMTAQKQFFNDSTITGLHPITDDTLVVDFGLLHPEFSLNFQEVNVSIENENVNDFYEAIRNTGSGPLEFTSSVKFVGGDPDRDEMFDEFLSIDVTNTVVGENEEGDTLLIENSHIIGVTFVDSLFYISGGGNARRDVFAAIYRFTREGEFIDSLQLPWMDNWGLRGLAYDGHEFIYGCMGNHIYQLEIDSSMAIVDSFEVEPDYTQDLAYDPVSGSIYTSYITQEIFNYDLDGNLLGTVDPMWNGLSLRKYGLAWYAEQPDSLSLLINAKIDNISYLFGMNPESGEIDLLHEFRGDGEEDIKGMDMTGRWNSSVWTLCTISDNSDGDRLTVYEMDPNITWLSYSPVNGVIQAGQDTTLHIRVEAQMRPNDVYWVTLRYEHTAAPGFYEIPITMNIVDESGIGEDLALPKQFALEQNYPNPFNPSTTLRYSLPEAAHVRLAVFDTMGRLVGVLQDVRQNPGNYSVTFDATNLPNGVYVYRITADGNTASRKMVLMK